ncbi:MAG TPA: hypothetical protein PK851_03290, partial [bacterium]|nr:hypothetical protein [bacterium]
MTSPDITGGSITTIDNTGRLPQAGPGSNINPIGNATGSLPIGSDVASDDPSFVANPNPNITPTAVGRITETSQLVSGPTVGQMINNTTGQIQYYNPADGKFYGVDKNGKTSPLSNKVFHN